MLCAHSGRLRKRHLWVPLWPTHAARRVYPKGAERTLGRSDGTGDIYHTSEESLTDRSPLLWRSMQNRSVPLCRYAWVFLRPHCLVATICSMPNYSHGRTASSIGLQLVLSSHRKRCFKLRTEGRKEGGVVRELGLPPQVQTYIFISKTRHYMFLLGYKSAFFRAAQGYLAHKAHPHQFIRVINSPMSEHSEDGVTSERRLQKCWHVSHNRQRKSAIYRQNHRII